MVVQVYISRSTGLSTARDLEAQLLFFVRLLLVEPRKRLDNNADQQNLFKQEYPSTLERTLNVTEVNHHEQRFEDIQRPARVDL
jgi:hypothetical protein